MNLLTVYRNGTTRMVGRWNYRNIREQMSTPLGAQRALLRLYSFQTEDERTGGRTSKVNARGFNQADAPFMTDMARRTLRQAMKDNVSPQDVAIIPEALLVQVQERLMKYAAQLADYANRADAAREKARREQEQQGGARAEERTSAQDQVASLGRRAGGNG